MPSTSASTCSPLSPKRTWAVSASDTTCAFVTIVPSLRTTKPVPLAAPAWTETTPGPAES